MTNSSSYPPHIDQDAAAYEADPGGIDIKELIAILKRRRWVIISTVLLLTTLATLIGLQITPTYTAKALVMIDPRQSNIVDVEAVMQGLNADQGTVETQMRVLKSRDLMNRVMSDLGLFDDPEFNARLREEDEQIQLKFSGPVERLLAWLPNEWLIATGLAEEPLPVEVQEDEGFLTQAALNRFDSKLNVTHEGRSFVIGVSFTSVNPKKAARVANTLADTYVEEQVEAKLLATAKASGWLGDRLEAMRDDVREAERAVERFRAENDMIESRGESLHEQELSELNRDLILARSEVSEKRARLALVRDLQRRGEGLDSIGEVLQSNVITNLRQQEAMLIREESELRTSYGEKHPKMRNLVAEKKNLQEKIATEVDRIIKNLENEVQVMSSRIATMEQELTEATRETGEERSLQVKLRELQREADANRELYEAFLQRFKETREQEEIVEPDARVISTASTPESPSSPGPKLFAAVGFTASLMLGTLLALLLERLDNGLRSSKQVEQALGMPALGLVPRLDKLKRGQMPHQYLIAKPLSAYSEALRAIYTSMQLSDVDNPPKIVLVTSSLPQEGKTTLALSLAVYAARSSQRVLLMDLDLRHPSVHRDLGATPECGFVEYMAGEKALDEVIHQDEETGLDYLPVKRQTANPTDLLGSRKMRQLLEELRARYDYVVMDSAPLLGVTDSKVVALRADKVLFATQWEKTNIETAQNGLQNLREVKANIAGAVLTQVNVRKHAYYGYGDVGQYYGKYQKYYVN